MLKSATLGNENTSLARVKAIDHDILDDCQPDQAMAMNTVRKPHPANRGSLCRI
ncbi:MAG TPA: hypothetical protein P5081_09580 [Phycisphaerae bacterium]|nr:hypothetical protein [Phycisphaerae bacterium]HRW53126.1 hypothetical protein [Phycisphaerae bacterium]